MPHTHRRLPDNAPLAPDRDNPCPVCGARMYAVQVEQDIYALPCLHWLYEGSRRREGEPPEET